VRAASLFRILFSCRFRGRSEEISAACFGDLVGLVARERLDEALYTDTAAHAEAAKREAAAEKRRLAAAAKARAHLSVCVRLSSGCVLFLTCSHLLRPQKRKVDDDGGGAGGAGGDDPPPAATAAAAVPSSKAAPAKASAGPIYYRVTVRDNGKGMSHEDIPNMLGRVLSGTKYGVRQARGKFGLGAKMALIWAKQTTGQPILVRSALPKQSFVSAYTLDLDLRTNAPHVHAAAKEANEERWHGTQVSVLIRGAWSTYSARIVKYLRQLAVITPYAQISFRYASEAGGRSDVALRFRRRTTHMPPPPLETVHHPSAGALPHGDARGCVCVRVFVALRVLNVC
jgi:hypothetical protein